MNRKKASEYFELIRGRKPTESELKNLLNKENETNSSVESNHSERIKKMRITKVSGVFQITLLVLTVLSIPLWILKPTYYYPWMIIDGTLGILSFVFTIYFSHKLKILELSRVGQAWSMVSDLLIVLVVSIGILGNASIYLYASLIGVYMFVLPMLCIGTVLTFLQHPKKYAISVKYARKIKGFSIIFFLLFIFLCIINVVRLIHLSKSEYLSLDLLIKFFIISGLVIIVALLIVALIKVNRYHPMNYIVLDLVFFLVFSGVSIYGIVLQNTYNDALNKIHEINTEIVEDKKTESLYFDGQYKLIVDKDSGPSDRARTIGNRIAEQQRNRIEKTFGSQIDNLGVTSQTTQLKEDDLDRVVRRDYLIKLNKRRADLSNYEFEIELFSKKLEKFQTTNDEQPLSNFFDLNTALKIINSKNYTGQITTNELETDGFLN
ncbi:hypothetical protein [Furfurilactobacillus rossiae]|uniref:Uncharacterized protein n=1 Tax=Furfurilactobacillus rossiae DSM 15814 TaxID=1114972 RepID=A0A0R1RBM6_9LACO|nr:hypothetical protein [Furfurilactobacillus rossiae]KRL54311.1 hypothetical protein FD35_GL002648 [Furfurilactobacillus rossiae DSM 15814]QFR66960.1 hypothetical protein LR814_07550 [Furfurilactobacillus rossiae]QLE62460.1 hypothetical protein LROSRS0_2415 [Furfurilactobacillus rossiae]